MIVVDANMLLYAYDASSAQHAAAKAWFESTMSGSERVGLPVHSLLAFIRIGTSPSVFQRPLAPAAAISAVQAWIARQQTTIVTPTDRHWEILERLATAGQVRGSAMMDAHLAALTIEHGANLATTDRGFARFPGLRFTNPIDR